MKVLEESNGSGRKEKATWGNSSRGNGKPQDTITDDNEKKCSGNNKFADRDQVIETTTVSNIVSNPRMSETEMKKRQNHNNPLLMLSAPRFDRTLVNQSRAVGTVMGSCNTGSIGV
jgi:hypothetical protein